MKPRIICTACGAELGAGDRFCSSCGSPVELGGAPSDPVRDAAPTAPADPALICPLCGQRNSPGAETCASCGNGLRGSGARSRSPSSGEKKKTPRVTKSPPLKFFQSWRLTVLLAAVLILTVVLVSMNQRKGEPQEKASPQAAAMSGEIDSLQHMVDRNPKDAPLLLQLANLLHDAKLYARSIVMYDRYLQLNPSDPNARVDMGISYFELSFDDTLHAQQFISTAIDEIKRALTYAPNHQLAHFNLGIILLHSGDMDQARQYLEKCVRIDSTSDVGRRAEQFLTQHAFNKSTTS